MTAFLPYRPCVGAMLLNDAKQVFVARRIDTTAEAWQMPQGGIDPGEDPLTALRRELLEEIGTDRYTVLAESDGWLRYDLPDALIGKLWGGNYRGQEQKWFCLRFTGQDSDITLETAHAEFSDWKWVLPKALPELIVPFKRSLYRELLRRFAEHL